MSKGGEFALAAFAIFGVAFAFDNALKRKGWFDKVERARIDRPDEHLLAL